MEKNRHLDRGYNTIKHCDKTAKTVSAVFIAAVLAANLLHATLQAHYHIMV